MCFADSSDVAWCAGALAVCQRHAVDGRVWYRFIRPWYFWAAVVLIGFLPTIVRYASGRPIPSTAFGAISLVAVTVLLWTLYFLFERLFPSVVLVLRRDENWVRRNATELTVALAMLGVLVSLIGLFR